MGLGIGFRRSSAFPCKEEGNRYNTCPLFIWKVSIGRKSQTTTNLLRTGDLEKYIISYYKTGNFLCYARTYQMAAIYFELIKTKWTRIKTQNCKQIFDWKCNVYVQFELLPRRNNTFVALVLFSFVQVLLGLWIQRKSQSCVNE